MAYYCRVAHAERAVNNGVRILLELLDDPDPAILDRFDITLQFPPDGTNARKRQAIRDQLIQFIEEQIKQRETADANAGTVISQLIGLRYPNA
jgi:cytochrome P450